MSHFKAAKMHQIGFLASVRSSVRSFVLVNLRWSLTLRNCRGTAVCVCSCVYVLVWC